MSSPPPSNILLDPITELETALRNNAFGINSSTSRLIYESSFPVTPEDKQRIASDSPKSGTTAHEVIAKAEIGLLEGDIAEVVLDRRGYTLKNVTSTETKIFPETTYESLDAMLIAVSPGYVEAMGQEVGRRFEGFKPVNKEGRDGAQTSREEVREAEGGEGWGR